MATLFTIPAGGHFAKRLHLSLLLGNTYIAFKAKFYENCIYEPMRVPEQINKLYGMSYGLHHRCSARIGWRSDGRRIEILSYLYSAPRIRVFESMGFIDAEQWHTFTIRRDHKMVYLTMDRQQPRAYALKAPFPIGYRLFPYFGGEYPAPHTMSIEVVLMGMNGFGF
jgi:hypothetical protein